MTVSISANLAQTQSASRPPAPTGLAAQPKQAEAIIALGSMLTQEAQESILTGAQQLQSTGATFEEIKSFVDEQMEASGVDISAAQQTGQLISVVS